MNLCVIGCLYKNDIYSHHCYDLVKALEKKGNISIKIVTSNCSCFSSSQKFGCTMEELLTYSCEIVKIPYAPLHPTKKYGKFKYYVTKFGRLNLFFETARGVQFFYKTRRCEIIHFDQVLKSFGFLSFLSFLFFAVMGNKKIIVTVHELDPIQQKYKRLNRYYNRVDKILVHSKDTKNELTDLGIVKNKVEIIPYGARLEPLIEVKRDQFIYFGGHRLLVGKGFDTLLEALKIVESEGRYLKLVIYTGEGCVGLDEGKKMACDMGLDKFIRWIEFIHGSKLTEAFQRSVGCIIPYTGGSGIYPATSAMVNATPVIATRKASLPEYLGDLGIYIEQNASDQLADAIINLMDHENTVRALGRKLRHRAEENYTWDKTAEKVLGIYKEVGLASLSK
jgi:glycosyltransferase involved in cell wall biosynthesis